MPWPKDVTPVLGKEPVEDAELRARLDRAAATCEHEWYETVAFSSYECRLCLCSISREGLDLLLERAASRKRPPPPPGKSVPLEGRAARRHRDDGS